MWLPAPTGGRDAQDRGWIGANGYGAAGPYREIHPYGRENDLFRAEPTDDASILVEIQLPVEERSAAA
ncbi:MAG TPA: hypothetical protein VKA51_03285 [Rubrobacteraceae bacterium]|nr:hypothetical protein [Rubrobacteraceae bacterium]